MTRLRRAWQTLAAKQQAAVKRLGWTMLAAGLGALAAVPVLDMAALRAAALAGLVSGINAALLIARRNSLPEEQTDGV